MKRELVVVDFETAAIYARPYYPPVPAGVSILRPGKKAEYLAWGHPTKNNCDKAHATEILRDLWAGDDELLFHNAKFDLAVAEERLGLAKPSWDRVHDTMFLLFLSDPHATTFALKPSAERLLGMPPTERDAVRDWLVQAGLARANSRDWGARIASAPGDLVGKYAAADTKMTKALFKKLHAEIKKRGMVEAYDRERQLLPILLENEQQGVRVDLKKLNQWVVLYSNALTDSDRWLRERLKAKELNVDSDAELAEALFAAGVVTDFETTTTGKRSVSKKTLTPDKFKDPQVAAVLGYRSRLSTCLSTFIIPWLATAEQTGGVVHTNWNQVRTQGAGARTGRMSSNPNFQNIPKGFEDKDDDFVHPDFAGLPPLPMMREIMLPDRGEMFCHRDYNQQELRILAHYEDGALLKAYQDQPHMDMHTFVQGEIQRLIGLQLERKTVKNTNFGLLYGMGLNALAAKLKTSVDSAAQIRRAQRGAMPGLVALENALKSTGAGGDPIRTWGGREYYVEDPKIIDGQARTFEYKLLNYLIQGSAADITKQALINYAAVQKHGRFLTTVHDEINFSCPKTEVAGEMQRLSEAMADIQIDVPMLSDGKVGKNWCDLKKFKDS